MFLAYAQIYIHIIQSPFVSLSLCLYFSIFLSNYLPTYLKKY